VINRLLDSAADMASSPKIHKLDSMIIQHDWNEINQNDKFFVGYKTFGKKSQFVDIRVLDDLTYKAAEDDILIERVSPSKLRVQLRSDIGPVVFIAPASQFDCLHTAAVNSVDISSTGKFGVSAGSDGKLLIWQIDTGIITHVLEGHIMDVNRCRFFPSGLVVLSAGIDMSVRVWSVETGQCVRTFNGHTRSVLDLAIHGDGKDVFSCSKDGTVKRWSCATSECLTTWTPTPENVPINAITISCTIIACGADNGTVTGYNLESEKKCFEFSLGQACTAIHLSEIYKNTDESDPTLICYAGNSEGEIHCFDVAKNLLVAVLRTDCGRVCALNSVKQGLIGAFVDGSIKIIANVINAPHTIVEFTGADCDPVYDFALLDGLLVSACRDKSIRGHNVFI